MKYSIIVFLVLISAVICLKEDTYPLRKNKISCEDLDHQYPYLTQIPLVLGSVYPFEPERNSAENLRAYCFYLWKINTTIHYLNEEKTSLKVVFDIFFPNKQKAVGCIDNFMFGTTFNEQYNYFVKPNSHQLELVFDNPRDIIDLKKNGVTFYTFCQDWTGFINSAIEQLGMLAGGLGLSRFIPTMGNALTNYQKEQNKLLLEKVMSIELQDRVIDIVDIDKSLIKSGDLLLVRRLDGVQPFLMMSSGSHIGHAAMALWEGNTLWIVESQEAAYFESGKTGIQKNKYEDWLLWANSADYDVAWIRMKEDLRNSTFNLTKAWEFFNETEGRPYGHKQQIFAIIDTPDKNFPLPFQKENVPIIIKYIAQMNPKLYNDLLKDGLKKRLGLKASNKDYDKYEDLYIKAIVDHNLTLTQLMAIPENDDFAYENEDGSQKLPVYSSSTFIAALYKAAGMFEKLTVNAQEFNLKDIYQVNFFDTKKSNRPEKCKEADPKVPYCQLMGDYRIYLPGFSTIKPYSHMNENCTSSAPLYERQRGC